MITASQVDQVAAVNQRAREHQRAGTLTLDTWNGLYQEARALIPAEEGDLLGPLLRMKPGGIKRRVVGGTVYLE